MRIREHGGWRRVFVCLLLALPAIPARAQEVVTPTPGDGEPETGPVRIRSLDPLAMPRPVIDVALAPVPDDRSAGEKITSEARRVAAAAEPGARLQTLVLLHLPALADPLAADEPPPRKLRVAAAAWDFLDASAGIGFEAVRGYGNVPAVLGDIAATDLERLAAVPGVRAVQTVRKVHAHRVEGMALIHARRGALGASGLGAGVAILDTGIEDDHPELRGRVVAEGDFTEEPTGTEDVDGHGTNVAGIVAGAGGVAPKASLWSVKVLDDEGVGTGASILGGLDAVLENRSLFGGVDVVNLSLGSEEVFAQRCDFADPVTTAAMNALVGAGIVVVASSGNEASKQGIAWPACIGAVVAVGAVYDASLGGAFFGVCTDPVTAADRVTCYSNSAPILDLLAPSHCARTPDISGGYRACFGGTSASAPYTAGVVAQLRSLRPEASPATILAALSKGPLVVDPANQLARPRIDLLAAIGFLSALPAD